MYTLDELENLSPDTSVYIVVTKNMPVMNNIGTITCCGESACYIRPPFSHHELRVVKIDGGQYIYLPMSLYDDGWRAYHNKMEADLYKVL